MGRFLAPMGFVVLALAAAGCDGDDGQSLSTTDATPPAVTLDAFIPPPAGAMQTVTVSPTSGDKSVVLESRPVISLIAKGEDVESAIKRLEISGEYDVLCRGEGELGEQLHGTMARHAVGTPTAEFSRIVKLEVDLGKQAPNDREHIAHCPANTTPTSISGKFSATAVNGVDMEASTATFRFLWERSS